MTWLLSGMKVIANADVSNDVPPPMTLKSASLPVPGALTDVLLAVFGPITELALPVEKIVPEP